MLVSWKKSYVRQHFKKKRHYFAKVHLVKAMVFLLVMYGCESWSIKKAECWRTDDFGEDSWESLWQERGQSQRKSTLNILWKDWCWNSNTLATWYEESIHWQRLWCWEGLKAGGEAGDRGSDGWMASLIQWTWVWGSSGR